MSQHGAGKLKSGVCTVYPTANLLQCPPPPLQMVTIALNEYFPAGEPQGGHSSFPFWWQIATARWWDDLGLFPAHLEVPPLHHIADITLPTLHQMRGLSWYPRSADPPPPVMTPEPPLRTDSLPHPPTYATRNPSLHPDLLAPPMPRNFVDGLGQTVTGDALTSADCKAAWERVEKIWGGGGSKVSLFFDVVFNV